jgi:hypothetical protein
MLFSKSVTKVNDSLSKKIYDKPVLIVLSESDSVINSKAVVNLFQNRFTHSESRLIWYANTEIIDPRIINLPSSLKEYKISNFSHMGLLFKPENRYY